jgi:hypothetical protein
VVVSDVSERRAAGFEVRRLWMASSGVESWTVIGPGRAPVAVVDEFLAWLTRIERSPNTVRAYAQDLKAFWEFLSARDLAWHRLTLEQLGLFTAWLRQPADNVVLLAGAEPRRAVSTVNRMLSAVMGFCDFHARHGVAVARALGDRSRSGAAATGRFWTGIAPARPRARVGRLRESRRPPRTLSLDQVAAVLEAQRRGDADEARAALVGAADAPLALAETAAEVAELAAAVAERGVDTVTLALAWVLSHPQVTAVVVGPRRPEHLEPALRALELPLTPEERGDLAHLFDP